MSDVTQRTDTELLLWAVSTASGSRSAARWVHVMRIFKVGSTTARRLCERAGVDPDETVAAAAKEDGA